jgi:hypothetical protein
MRKAFAVLALVLFAASCGGDGSGPNTSSLTGTWIGDYTNSADPGSVYQGVLQVTQSGTTVTGTLTTNAGRSANLSATLSGTQLSGTLSYTDGCTGSASTTTDIVQSGTQLTGNYTSSDCLGQTTGGYSLLNNDASAIR